MLVDNQQHPVSELLVQDLIRVGVAIQRMNKHFERELNLSLVQYCVLKCLLDMPGISAHVLADTVGVHPSTLTQSIRRLSKKGYLFIDVDPLDSRKKIISITRDGKRAIDSASELIARSFSKKANLRNLLDQLKAAFPLEGKL